MNQELKEILIKNINEFDNIYYMDRYLKTYQQPESNFNYSDFNDLKIYLMHQYHNSKNLFSLFDDPCSVERLKSISKTVEELKSIPTNLSQEEFAKEINKLKFKYDPITNNFLQRLHNTFNSKVLGSSGWFKVYSNKVIGAEVKDITHKIYLAIDNESLHKFALLLVKYCELYNISYQFKINNGDGQNCYDNVVIYSNENELSKYINCITEILNLFPNIKVNKSCPIGYQYDDNIVVAPYIDTEFESYSNIVSDKISYYRECAEDRVEFLENVDNYLNDILFSTKELCDKIKYSNREIKKNSKLEGMEIKEQSVASVPDYSITDEQLDAWLATDEGMEFLASIMMSADINKNSSDSKIIK